MAQSQWKQIGNGIEELYKSSPLCKIIGEAPSGGINASGPYASPPAPSVFQIPQGKCPQLPRPLNRRNSHVLSGPVPRKVPDHAHTGNLPRRHSRIVSEENLSQQLSPGQSDCSYFFSETETDPLYTLENLSNSLTTPQKTAPSPRKNLTPEFLASKKQHALHSNRHRNSPAKTSLDFNHSGQVCLDSGLSGLGDLSCASGERVVSKFALFKSLQTDSGFVVESSEKSHRKLSHSAASACTDSEDTDIGVSDPPGVPAGKSSLAKMGTLVDKFGKNSGQVVSSVDSDQGSEIIAIQDKGPRGRRSRVSEKDSQVAPTKNGKGGKRTLPSGQVDINTEDKVTNDNTGNRENGVKPSRLSRRKTRLSDASDKHLVAPSDVNSRSRDSEVHPDLNSRKVTESDKDTGNETEIEIKDFEKRGRGWRKNINFKTKGSKSSKESGAVGKAKDSENDMVELCEKSRGRTRRKNPDLVNQGVGSSKETKTQTEVVIVDSDSDTEIDESADTTTKINDKVATKSLVGEPGKTKSGAEAKTVNCRTSENETEVNDEEKPRGRTRRNNRNAVNNDSRNQKNSKESDAQQNMLDNVKVASSCENQEKGKRCEKDSKDDLEKPMRRLRRRKPQVKMVESDESEVEKDCDGEKPVRQLRRRKVKAQTVETEDSEFEMNSVVCDVEKPVRQSRRQKVKAQTVETEDSEFEMDSVVCDVKKPVRQSRRQKVKAQTVETEDSVFETDSVDCDVEKPAVPVRQLRKRKPQVQKVETVSEVEKGSGKTSKAVLPKQKEATSPVKKSRARSRAKKGRTSNAVDTSEEMSSNLQEPPSNKLAPKVTKSKEGNTRMPACDSKDIPSKKEQSREPSQERPPKVPVVAASNSKDGAAQADVDSETPKKASTSSSNKDISLSDWFLRPIRHVKGIIVEGDRVEIGGSWHSTCIVHRVDQRTLMTASGSIYKLVGNININDTVEQGFTKSFARAFKTGFPPTWKELISQHFNKPTRKPKGAAQKKEPHLLGTPANKMIDISMCKRSSSGRTLIPSHSIEWWKCVRVRINKETAALEIRNDGICESVHKAKKTQLKESRLRLDYFNSPDFIPKKTDMNCSISRKASTSEKDIFATPVATKKKAEKRVKKGGKSSKNDTVVKETKKTAKNTHKKIKTPKRKLSKSDKSKMKLCSVLVTPLPAHSRKKSGSGVGKGASKPEDKQSNTRRSGSVGFVTSPRSFSKKDFEKNGESSMDSQTNGRTMRAAKRKADDLISKHNETNSPAVTTSKRGRDQLDSSDEDFNDSNAKQPAKRRRRSLKGASGKTDNKRTSVGESGQLMTWSLDEVERLKLAIRQVPQTTPSFWLKVSSLVGTRTEEECQDFHYKDAPESSVKKKPNPAPQTNSAKKFDKLELTEKVGTMKRKTQLRNIMEKQDENFAADFFDSTPFKSQKLIKVGEIADIDGQAFGCPDTPFNLQTPGLTGNQFNFLKPLSDKKTPHSNLFTPGVLRSVNRRENDLYIHRMLKGKKPVRKLLQPRRQSVGKASPQPGLALTENQKSKIFHVTDLEEDAIDPDEDEDYYWSDTEVQ